MKIRGTAQHIAEKYAQLARDAQASGDPVAAENYFQHAEHYFRIIAAAQEQLREQFGYQQRFDDEGDDDSGFAAGERFGEDSDIGSQPQPFEARPERLEADRQPRFDRGGDRPDRNDRPDRGERPDRNDRRERFQRERGPRPDFQRSDTETRPERGDRAERPEFRRERRREDGDSEAAALPAFLTNPVRPPPLAGSPADNGEAAPAVENGVTGENGADFRTRRRRRRTRFGGDDAGGESTGFSPEVIETPAAE